MVWNNELWLWLFFTWKKIIHFKKKRKKAHELKFQKQQIDGTAGKKNEEAIWLIFGKVAILYFYALEHWKLPWLLSGVVVCLCVRTPFPLPCVCVCVCFSKKKKKKALEHWKKGKWPMDVNFINNRGMFGKL